MGESERTVLVVDDDAAIRQVLEAMVSRGEFRSDLYYRLNVVPVVLPPLRARPDDIPLLVRHFLAKHGGANGRPDAAIPDAAMALLAAEAWPGNVRQLENFIERLVVLADGPEVSEREVREELARLTGSAAPVLLPPPGGEGPHEETLDGQKRSTERAALVAALDRAGNNRTVAARVLGISRRTLYNKLAEYGIR